MSPTLNTIKYWVLTGKTTPNSTEQVLCLSAVDVRKTWSRVNMWKAVGSNNIPGQMSRECADKLADVLIGIFNISMS